MGNQEPRVAYIVICWNNKKIIGECIDSIQKQTAGNKAIYVIDNKSSDGSANYIAKHYPDVNLTAANENSGFARGNNILIRKALEDQTIKYFVLINSDAVLDERWAEEIISGISGKRKVACAQGTTLDYFNRQRIDSQHIFVRDDFQSVQFGYTEKYREAYAHPRRVFGVNAAAALYTREFIESQPERTLFDERFYMYLEDVDVAFRAVMAGWSNYYIPAAKAYHMGSASSKKRASGYNYYMTCRNQTALLVKNAPLHTLFRFMSNFIRNDIRFYRHYSQEDKEILRNIFKGRAAGLLRAPLYLGSRFRLAKDRKMNTEQLERVMKNNGLFR